MLSKMLFSTICISAWIFPHVCLNVSSLFIFHQHSSHLKFLLFPVNGQIEVRWIGKIFPLGIAFALTSTAKVYPRSELLFTFLSELPPAPAILSLSVSAIATLIVFNHKIFTSMRHTYTPPPPPYPATKMEGVWVCSVVVETIVTLAEHWLSQPNTINLYSVEDVCDLGSYVIEMNMLLANVTHVNGILMTGERMAGDFCFNCAVLMSFYPSASISLSIWILYWKWSVGSMK